MTDLKATDKPPAKAPGSSPPDLWCYHFAFKTIYQDCPLNGHERRKGCLNHPGGLLCLCQSPSTPTHMWSYRVDSQERQLVVWTAIFGGNLLSLQIPAEEGRQDRAGYREVLQCPPSLLTKRGHPLPLACWWDRIFARVPLTAGCGHSQHICLLLQSLWDLQSPHRACDGEGPDDLRPCYCLIETTKQCSWLSMEVTEGCSESPREVSPGPQKEHAKTTRKGYTGGKEFPAHFQHVPTDAWDHALVSTCSR